MPTFTPEIIQWTPDKNAINVLLNPTLTVTFNTDMAIGTINTVNITLRDSLNALVPITIDYRALTRTAEIHANQQLDPDALYMLKVFGDDVTTGMSVDGVTDILGHPMVGSFTLSFTTGEEIGTPYNPSAPPSVPTPSDSTSEPFDIVSVYPGINASNVSAGRIVIEFSNKIDQATANSANVYIIKKANL